MVARNGTANIILRDIELQFRLSPDQVKKYLNLEDAEKLGLIKIIMLTDAVISINIKAKETEVKLTKKQQKAILSPSVGVGNMPSETKPETLPDLVKSPDNLPAIVQQDQTGLILGRLPDNYIVRHELRQRCIGIYIKFYQNIIQERAMLAGHFIENPAKPNISPADSKFIMQLAQHFFKSGFKTEQQICIAFQRMFDMWPHLPDNFREWTSPGQIMRNINGIVLKLQEIALNLKKTKLNKRDEQYSEKLTSTDARDYSHLGGKGY